MSHNATTVNTQPPDATGEISQTLDNLSDVAPNNPANGQGLAWGGVTWSEYTAKPNKGAIAQGLNTSTGAFTSSYYDSIYEQSDGFYLNLRWQFGSPQYLMSLSDTSYASNYTYTFAVNSRWWRGFTLQAGYKFQLVADVVIPSNSSAGAYVELQWRTDGGVNLGHRGFARRPEENRTRFHGFIDLTSASSPVNVGLYNHGMGGNVAWSQAGSDQRHYICTARVIE